MNIIKTFFVGLVFMLNLMPNQVHAQGSYEEDLSNPDYHYVKISDGVNGHYYGYRNEEGEWAWIPWGQIPAPWPPYDMQDHSSNGGHDSDDYDFDEESDDDDWWNDDPTDPNDDDDWFEHFWDDPWEDWHWTSGPSNTTCPSLRSRTDKAPNWTRTTVGIGEVVEVRIKDNCGTAKWSIEGVGKLIEEKPSYCKFQADWDGGDIRIIVEILGGSDCGSGCQLQLQMEFKVITPTGVYFEPIAPCSDGLVRHDHNYPSAGYKANIYLMPDNVNFYKVETKELDTPSPGNGVGSLGGTTCSGPYFTSSNMLCPAHIANTMWAPYSEYVELGKGTKSLADDNIYFIMRCKNSLNSSPTLAGSMLWEIDWVYKSGSGQVTFCTVNQLGENIGGTDSEFRTSKGNSSKAAKLTAPSVCGYPGLNCPD